MLSSFDFVICGMVHKLSYYRKSYSGSEEFYNSNNGNLHKMRIKGRKEFIPYALFEAFKARDQRLELVPHYSYYLEFLKRNRCSDYSFIYYFLFPQNYIRG